MMPFTTAPRGTSIKSRLPGGAGLLLFLVAAVIVPLWSALSLCSMPCCQHESSPVASATSQDPCCAVNASEASNDAVAISAAATPQRTLDTAETAAALTVSFIPSPTVAVELATHVHHPLDSHLHILNSVFLI